MKSKIEEMIKDSGVKLFSDRQLLKEALGIINQSLAGGDFHFGNLSTTLEEIRRRTEGVKMPDLNSQDQEEECRYFNGDEPIKDKETIELMKGLPDRVWEDTPEQTESDVQEWEEEWHSTPVYNQISFIKNLLKEREREAYEKGYRKSEINNLEYRVYKIATERGYKEYHYYLDDRGFLVVEEVEELDKLKDKK